MILVIVLSSGQTLAADSNALSLNNAGIQCLGRGDFLGAIQSLEECVNKFPNYQLARTNLSIAYNNYALSLTSTNPAKASEFFSAAVKLDPNNTTFADNLRSHLNRNVGKNANSAMNLKPLDHQKGKESVDVKFGGDVEKKFPCLKVVLNQLLETLGTGLLWDSKFWLSPIPTTGTVRHDKFFQVAAEMRRYLTDGKLQIVFRPDPRPPRLGRAGGDTPNRTTINLHIKSGSWGVPDQKTYCNYDLAVTIFHELMHVWQHDHWFFSGNIYPAIPWDKEMAPTLIETQLPKDLFKMKRYQDPGGSDPVPPSCEDDVKTAWMHNEPAIFKEEGAKNQQIVEIAEDRIEFTDTKWNNVRNPRMSVTIAGLPTSFTVGQEIILKTVNHGFVDPGLDSSGFQRNSPKTILPYSQWFIHTRETPLQFSVTDTAKYVAFVDENSVEGEYATAQGHTMKFKFKEPPPGTQPRIRMDCTGFNSRVVLEWTYVRGAGTPTATNQNRPSAYVLSSITTK